MLANFDFLPKRYRADVFIAGGYAADQELAGDIDVWVTVRPGTLDRARNEILKQLDNDGVPHSIEVDSRAVSNDAYSWSLKVAMIFAGVIDEKPIHVIVTENNPWGVLASFDISTHQIAILNDGEILKGENWTPINTPPIKLKDTATTDERIEKITKRYEHLYEMHGV